MHLSLMEILHKEFQTLRKSVEYSQQQVEWLAAENVTLKELVKSLTNGMMGLIDLQAHSMRDNLIFSGIPEKKDEDPETTVKEIIQTHLKLSEGTAKMWPNSNTLNILVKSHGQELKETVFSI